jgi:hypothetical protein
MKSLGWSQKLDWNREGLREGAIPAEHPIGIEPVEGPVGEEDWETLVIFLL